MTMLPGDAGQTKCTTTVTTRYEQASEYDHKQSHVGNFREDMIKCAGIVVTGARPRLHREPYRVNQCDICYVKVECNDDPRYNDRHHYNLIYFPKRNSGKDNQC